LAQEAEKLRLEARAEAVNAQVSQYSAEKARKAAVALKEKADASAKVANEQKANAERNLQAAQAATQRANEATAAAQQSAQRLAGALERGELIRSGLESYRREQYPLAQDAFEKLEVKLKALRSQVSDQNFTPQQLRQFERDYGWSQSRLGDTYHKLRQFDKAIEHYENGRVILEQVLKDEPAPILFETYHGLAHAYHDNAKARTDGASITTTSTTLTTEQQLAKAEDYYKKAATYQESLTTNNPVAAAASLKNLVSLYMDIGKYDEAEQRLKEVVETYKKVEPEPGDGTIGALKDLAEFYRGRSGYEDALRTYNQLIDIQEKITDTTSDPESIRALADNYNELSQIHNALKDETRSEAAFRLAERIQQIVLKLRNQP